MRLTAAFFAFFCLLAAPAFAAPSFPALSGRVVDDAKILNDSTKADLEQKLAALESRTSRQLVVVTLTSLQGYDISDYGYQLGRAWGIGQAKLNNGVLFLIAPKERRARIEVGYGLEPILTDAFSSLILQRSVLPQFRSNDYDAGVVAGVDALIEQLSLETSQAEARAAAAAQASGRGQGEEPSLGAIFIVLAIVFAIIRIFGGWGALPLLMMGGGPRRGGGFGGGFGGGGFGGGGFGGGGGSFGGGGSSGSW